MESNTRKDKNRAAAAGLPKCVVPMPMVLMKSERRTEFWMSTTDDNNNREGGGWTQRQDSEDCPSPLLSLPSNSSPSVLSSSSSSSSLVSFISSSNHQSRRHSPVLAAAAAKEKKPELLFSATGTYHPIPRVHLQNVQNAASTSHLDDDDIFDNNEENANANKDGNGGRRSSNNNGNTNNTNANANNDVCCSGGANNSSNNAGSSDDNDGASGDSSNGSILLQDCLKNLHSFLRAIDHSRLAQPISAEEKLKVLGWLRADEYNNNNDDEEEKQWHQQPSPSPSAMSCLDVPVQVQQERVQQLRVSRDSLSLQVAVLGQQVALQREKIRDLESALLDTRRRNSLSSELAAAPAAMMAQELADLQHKCATLQRDKLEAERRLRLSNSELERFAMEQQQQAAATTMNSSNAAPQNGDVGVGMMMGRQEELIHLQQAVQALIADNEQKDTMIRSLRIALDEQHRRLLVANATSSCSYEQQQQQPMDINEQIRRLLIEDAGMPIGSNNISSSSVTHSSSYPLSLCCSDRHHQQHMLPPPPLPSTSSASSSSRAHQQQACQAAARLPFMPFSASYSSALCHHQQQQQQQQQFVPPPPIWHMVAASPPSIPPHLGQSPKTPASPLARQLAAELDELRRSGNVHGNGGAMNSCIQQQKQQQQQRSHHQPYSSASFPRSIHSKANSIADPVSSAAGGHTKFLPPTSSPHFESDDETASRVSSAAATSGGGGDGAQQQQQPLAINNNNSKASTKRGGGRRGRSTLRTFLNKFAHRGNSLQDLRSPRPSFPASATIQPSPQPSLPSSSSTGQICLRQFVDWQQPKCARWLTEHGFQCANPGAIRTGRHLLNMSSGELERELGIRSALERKRLRCVLDRMERGGEPEPADRMDTNQVMLWLDLVGLPQFRDLFAQYRMDGHLLLALTAQDLLELGIHSALNHASLARGIQFLRSVEFHLHRVERHFPAAGAGATEPRAAAARSPCPADVERWSHGCTLEWLCSVDLAEFTPNLVFSGLHGALMVLEPTYTAESLADMLQIPAQKTLLRRHLTNQFNGLLGQQVIARKREMLAQPGVTHLVPALRIRLAAKRGFSLASRKKSRSDVFVEPEWRVCPPTTTAQGTATGAAAAEQQANTGEEVSDV